MYREVFPHLLICLLLSEQHLVIPEGSFLVPEIGILFGAGAHAVPPATDVSYVNGWEEIDPLSRVEMKKMCWQKDDSIVSVLYSLPL